MNESTEFSFTCGVCGLRESWTTSAATIAASIWHLYEHPEPWRLLRLDGRQPRSQRPETLGRKFEDWESQL